MCSGSSHVMTNWTSHPLAKQTPGIHFKPPLKNKLVSKQRLACLLSLSLTRLNLHTPWQTIQENWIESVSLRKSKDGFLNPKESENRFCVIPRFPWRSDWSVGNAKSVFGSSCFGFKKPILDFLKETHPWFSCLLPILISGQVQMPYFTWAESNANEQNPLFSLICIRFGSCEVRRLNLASVYN